MGSRNNIITGSYLFIFLSIPAFFAPLAAEEPRSPDLEKEFYNDYLDSLPDVRAMRKKTLERNLLTAVKRIVPREDPLKGPDHVRALEAKALIYKKIKADTVFVRGIFHEMPYLRPTPYMWIVKSGSYMLFVTFRVDPRKYIVNPFQVRAVIKRKKKKKAHD